MKTKFVLSLCASFLAAFMIVSALPINGEEAIYDDMIRLHVIANSDTDADQALKLKVRDAVLEAISSVSETNKADAENKIAALIPEIEKAAEKVIHDNGYDYSVSAVLGEEEYPERDYDGFILPAGKYTSLRVIIGSGAGHNWWCVLFPPLCTTSAEKREDVFIAAGFTGEQYRTITETGKAKYKVKFKLLEILEEIFG